jgi:RNA recognition motif-containing protein
MLSLSKSPAEKIGTPSEIKVLCIDSEKEKFSIYIRNVPTHVTRQMITEAAEQEFGPVRSVDIPTGKNMAFVEFASQETAARAIGHQMQVGGEALLAEERRKTGQNNGSNRGRFQGANYQGRGGNQNQQRGGRGGGAYAGRGREKGNANSSS